MEIYTTKKIDTNDYPTIDGFFLDLMTILKHEVPRLKLDFHNMIDGCATPYNTKFYHYFTAEENSLLQNWSKHAKFVWLASPYGGVKNLSKKEKEEVEKIYGDNVGGVGSVNTPFSDSNIPIQGAFALKALEQAKLGVKTVGVFQARTNEAWWFDLLHDSPDLCHVIHLRERLKFYGEKENFGIGTEIVIFGVKHGFIKKKIHKKIAKLPCKYNKKSGKPNGKWAKCKEIALSFKSNYSKFGINFFWEEKEREKRTFIPSFIYNAFVNVISKPKPKTEPSSLQRRINKPKEQEPKQEHKHKTKKQINFLKYVEKGLSLEKACEKAFDNANPKATIKRLKNHPWVEEELNKILTMKELDEITPKKKRKYTKKVHRKVKVNENQERFCQGLSHLNIKDAKSRTKAYSIAYPNSNNPCTDSYKLFKKPHIQKRLLELTEKKSIIPSETRKQLEGVQLTSIFF